MSIWKFQMGGPIELRACKQKKMMNYAHDAMHIAHNTIIRQREEWV